MKPCSKCGEVKPLEGYSRNKNSRDGRLGQCKTCVAAIKAEYYSRPEVKERAAEHAAEYRARPEVKARQAAKSAEYHAENRERLNAQSREYYAENRDELLAQKSEYHARPEVKERVRDYKSERNADHPHFRWEGGVRKRAKRYGVEPVIESFTKADVIDMYGDQCWHCESGAFDELDHFPVPVSRGGHHVLENVKPSCVECNRRSWRWTE